MKTVLLVSFGLIYIGLVVAVIVHFQRVRGETAAEYIKDKIYKAVQEGKVAEIKKLVEARKVVMRTHRDNKGG